MPAKKYNTEAERKAAAKASRHKYDATHVKSLSPAQKAKNVARAKAWREAHPDRFNEGWRRYYYRHRDEILERTRKQRRNRVPSVRAVLLQRLKTARVRSAKQGWAFDLTYDYLKSLYDKSPRCDVTGLPFVLDTSYGTISIDRITPEKHYTVGNVRLVRWHVNTAMGDWGEGPLLEMALALVARHKRRGKTVAA